MNTVPFEYWMIGGGLLLLGVLTIAALCYFFPIHCHKTKFKT